MNIPDAEIERLRSVDLRAVAAETVRMSRRGNSGLTLCLFHNERSPSLHVFADHFHCFGCGAHGDVIAWLMKARGIGFRDAVAHLGGQMETGEPVYAGHEKVGPDPDKQAERIAQGLKAWSEAGEPDRVALAYLEARGLIPPPMPVIRSRPRIWDDWDRRYPEMLVQVTDVATGENIGCQITRLAQDGSGKADTRLPRLNFCREGFARFCEPGEMLGLAEGTETALSVAAIFGVPVWGCLGRGLLEKAPPLPAVVKTVLIAADNDAPGIIAARAASAAYRARGLEVLERVPRIDGADFNDVLMHRARGARS
jgi:DNA primase